jgi:hypothetical protein
MWDSMSQFQQVFFVLALTSTAIMVILIIMMFIGMDEADGFDGDIDVDAGIDIFNDEPISGIAGLKILSIRGVLAFFSIGSWTVYLLSDVWPVWAAILLGMVSGSIASILLAYAFRAAMKLESVGNLDYRSAIGKPAMVYIKIPKEKTGRGKVIMNHQGRMLEVDALSNESEDLLRNTKVLVESLEDDSTLVVKKI